MSFFKPQITAWSYSRLKVWEECPLKAKFKFIDKIKEPDSPYASRGLEVHQQSATYLTTPDHPLPETLIHINEVMANLRTSTVKAELQVAFDKEWKPVEWFGPTVYCRVVYDVLDINEPVAYVADLKTGKMRPHEHVEQLSLYALAVMSGHPSVEIVRTGVLYADHPTQPGKNPLETTFERKDYEGLRAEWDERAGRMLADDIFAPRPGYYCRWCAYSKKKGGACPVN